MKTVVQEKRTKPNRLGLAGWIYGGRYGIERYLFILHRLTGLGILLYFMIHIFVAAQKIHGETAWNAAMAGVKGTIFHIGEYLVFVAIIFHGLNGLRLILSEFGLILGKPKRPIYPYTSANMRIRIFTYIIMLLAAIFIVIGGYDFFLIH
ncbi:MAG: succinate dehydrogenase [Calditrichaeota bacterium]|nr:succinate dehydrogenase [Calditrichota bacterium]